jgi:hypothetical protein
VVVLPGVIKLIRHGTEAKPERKCRNPATGKAMMVPPKPPGRKIVTRFPKAFKEATGVLPIRVRSLEDRTQDVASKLDRVLRKLSPGDKEIAKSLMYLMKDPSGIP